MAFLMTSIFTILEISFGYLVPVIFLLQGVLSSNKEGMKRWLTHFLFLFVLRSTVLCALNSVDMGIYSGTNYIWSISFN